MRNNLYSVMAFLNKPFVLIIHLLLASLSICAQYQNKIERSRTLTASDDGANWSSPSGDFAFGFLRIGTDGFLLCVWFNKIPEKTVVWSANGNNLVPEGSRVQLTSQGNLILNDPSGKQIWTDGTAADVWYAAMLDTGNFVLLASSSETIVWESFVRITDTMLPTQTFNLDGNLMARYSETNYSTGRFQLALQRDGNLVLYPREFPTDSVAPAYWASNTGNGFSLVFNLSTGSIALVDKSRVILKTLTSNTPSTKDFYHRAILEYDGVFRHYVYPRIGHESKTWPKAWTRVSNSTPDNICMAMNGGSVSGACGFNSYCSLAANQRPNCTCLPYYEFIDPSDVMKGCKPTFASQTCDQNLKEDFEIFTLENVNWPNSNYSHYKPFDEEGCKNECLMNCFCELAIFQDEECSLKSFPLSLGRKDPAIRSKAFVKISKGTTPFKSKRKSKATMIAIIWSVLGFLCFVLIVATLFIWYRFRKMKSRFVLLQGHSMNIPGENLRVFSYDELKKITNGFVEKLGRGTYATVYKGTIDSMDKTLVAVKRLDNAVIEADYEFKAEVNAIARTNHKNLVRLLGFCNQGEHRMLVYEFMPNGSLADFLFRPSIPNWDQRIETILGTARGLCYLHEECSTQIIHCDIKPQNILLDDSFTARIADFGLAKLLKPDQTRTMTAIRGTKGYIAAEWFRNLPITAKVDVYSFGILLLEIVCLRRSFEEKVVNENEKVLAYWVYDCFNEDKVELLVENDLLTIDDLMKVKNFVMIAIWCIQEEPSHRPSMKKVVQMLEGVVEVPIPPNPFTFGNANLSY